MNHRLAFNILFIILIIFSLHTPGATPSLDALRQGLANNDQRALDYLINLKSYLENQSEWDNETKVTYQSTVRILSDYASKNGFYDFQSSVLYDALQAYEDRDSIKNNPFRRDILVSLTVLYSNIKDYDKVLTIGGEAFENFLDAKDFGIGYITLMHNLASCAIETQDYTSAKSFIDEGLSKAKQLSKLRKGETLTIQCYLWNLKGRLAYHLDNFPLAEESYFHCINQAQGDRYKSIRHLAMNNLAVLYRQQNKFDKALEILECIKAEHASAECLINLLQLRYDTSQADSIIQQELADYNNIRYNQAIHVINSTGEKERKLFLDKISQEMIWYNNLIAGKYPEVSKEAFDANLFGRNINTAVNVTLRNILATQNNDFNIELINLRKHVVSKRVPEELKDSIWEQIAYIETQLLSTSNSALNGEIDYIGNWDIIKSMLTNEDAVISFSYLPKIINKNISCDYAAYITTSETELPVIVSLCNTDSLDNIILDNNFEASSISEIYSKSPNTLASTIWNPILPYILGKKNVYYTPTGILSLINIEAIPIKDGIHIGKYFDMKMLSSPSRIKDIKCNPSSFQSACLFGAPVYNMDVCEMTELSNKYNNYSGIDIQENIKVLNTTLRSGWEDLPWAEHEIKDIEKLLSSAAISTKSFLNKEATEENFKLQSGYSPDIIHIASHAFAYSLSDGDNYPSTAYQESINAINVNNAIMQLSGLVLSGGNNAWLGKEIPDNVEDGILTAEEISRLDLSNTKLVVLSACDTGRGHIDPVEGVWGLQRAFKEAGVESILMTLWKVPDSTTALFMEKFYTQLLKGRSVRQAVKDAQHYLIENGASDPFYWAPFVVLD